MRSLFVFHNLPVSNYAEGNTPYSTGFKISNVLVKLGNVAERLLQWFKDKRMKVNPGKYHLLINNNKESFEIKIGNKTVIKVARVFNIKLLFYGLILL